MQTLEALRWGNPNSRVGTLSQTISQRKVSTACRLVERETIGGCFCYCLRVGEIPSVERANSEFRAGEILTVKLGSQSSLSGNNLISGAANLAGL